MTTRGDHALNVVRASLDLQSIIANQHARPGGPTTARAALAALRSAADRAEQHLADRLDNEVPEAAPPPPRPPRPQRLSLTDAGTPRRR